MNYEFINKMNDVGTDHRGIFKMINIGKWGLSIQANEYAYCCPRKNLDDLNEYYSFEVAIVDMDNKEWINPRLDSRFSNYPDIIKYWSEKNCYVPPEIPEGLIPKPGEYVPKDIVQKLCNIIKEK